MIIKDVLPIAAVVTGAATLATSKTKEEVIVSVVTLCLGLFFLYLFNRR